jgi:hypothetical protein
MSLEFLDARLLMYSKLTDEEVDDLRAYVPRPVLYKVLVQTARDSLGLEIVVAWLSFIN